MNRKRTYLLPLLCALVACNGNWSKRFTLWRNDKIAYGTYYAYSQLPLMFHEAERIRTSSANPDEFYGRSKDSSAYIVIGERMRPSDDELKALLTYAYAGNTIFISAIDIGTNLLDSLRLKLSDRDFFSSDSLEVSILEPSALDSVPFSYPGLSLDRYFSDMDSSVTSILGKNEEGQANFVRLSYEGGGSIFIHLAPTAFTNFFLLHKQNKRYYDIALSYFPARVNEVIWDDYYRHHVDGNDESERSNFSKLRSFLDHEVLRWAFWLAVILFALVYLIESKRKQRFIPQQPKLNNSSLDFIKTVGRLYYQRRDNKNLASKMAVHFLAQVRSRYNISTAELNADFESRLAFRSGYPELRLKEMIAYIRSIEHKNSVSDEELIGFNEQLEKFYKHT